MTDPGAATPVESARTTPERPKRPLLGRPAVVAVISAVTFAVVMAWEIAGRSALTMDELHTALLARTFADGEVLPFWIGGVTRYEGGSWLIAWPVSALMRLGAYGSAATSWSAGAVAMMTVGFSSYWLAREVRPSAGLLLGGVAAAASPELVHYSYRAWGSLCEALVILPLGALLYSAWLDRGRPLLATPLLGMALAGAVVVSYLHMVTALVWSVVHLLEARSQGRKARRSWTELAIVAGSAVTGFAAWIVSAVPIRSEAWMVRDGRSLWSTWSDLLLVRIDKIAGHLPRAWIGSQQEVSELRLAAGIALSVLTIAAGVVLWRRHGRQRWLVVYAAG